MKRAVVTLTFVMSIGWMAQAQCPMCKASVESGFESENAKGKGLNDGILYLLATPYLAITAIGIAWYYKRKK